MDKNATKIWIHTCGGEGDNTYDYPLVLNETTKTITLSSLCILIVNLCRGVCIYDECVLYLQYKYSNGCDNKRNTI